MSYATHLTSAMSYFIQFAVIAALALYLVSQRIALGCRNRRSWGSLVARLPHRPLRTENGLSQKMSVGELWGLQKQARVWFALADYADRNETVDAAILLSIQSDALVIRWQACRAIIVRVFC